MKITEVKSVSSKPNPHNVDARAISDTESAQVVHITLQPGEALKKHITPVDVVFYVLEGRGGGGDRRGEGQRRRRQPGGEPGQNSSPLDQ